MGDPESTSSSQEPRLYGIGCEALRFALHQAAVYALTTFCIGWFASWVWAVLPFFSYARSGSSLQFFYSHLLIFSTVPAFLTGLLNARFRHRVAQFVWVLPATLLAYKLITFPEKASVFQKEGWPALHYYFGGGFLIGEWHSWRELFNIMLSGNPDIKRGSAQVRFTAPFYAGLAYSLATLLGLRARRIGTLLQAVREREIRGYDVEPPTPQDEASVINELPPEQQRAPVQ